MARPKQSLISKEAVLDIALEIITNEGLDALSIRRIASAIGVNAASLYYHFKNKEEIVFGAAELALSRTPLPLPSNSHLGWKEQLFGGVLQLRDFLLANPELLSVIVQRRLEGFANRYLEHVTKHLLKIGEPIEIINPLFEALERVTIGTVARQIAEGQISKAKNSLKGFPNLKAAAESRQINPDAIFDLSIMGIINAMEQQYLLNSIASKPAKKSARKSTKKSIRK